MIVTGVAVGNWVAERIGGFFDPVCMVAIGWQDAERVITAGVTFRDWNGVSIEGQIAVDRPLVPGFVRAMFDYPFRRLGARKILVTTTAANSRSLHLLDRLGFCVVARIPDASPGGDLIIASLAATECRFLGDRPHGKASLAASRS